MVCNIVCNELLRFIAVLSQERVLLTVFYPRWQMFPDSVMLWSPLGNDIPLRDCEKRIIFDTRNNRAWNQHEGVKFQPIPVHLNDIGIHYEDGSDRLG